MNTKIIAAVLLLAIVMHVHIVYKTLRERNKLETNIWINMILIIQVKLSIFSTVLVSDLGAKFWQAWLSMRLEYARELN